jgi:hypothetical protein
VLVLELHNRSLELELLRNHSLVQELLRNRMLVLELGSMLVLELVRSKKERRCTCLQS